MGRSGDDARRLRLALRRARSIIEDFARAIALVGDALDDLGVEWAVGGSLASATYGEPRATNDVDVAAILSPEDARRFARRLGNEFYADVEAAFDAASQYTSFNVLHQRTLVKVDVFILPPGPLGEGQLARRRRLSLFPDARSVPVLAPEDVVLQKLRWYASGGQVSDTQWRDILSVLRLAEEPLDAAYLDEVARSAGLGELLARAWKEARRT